MIINRSYYVVWDILKDTDKTRLLSVHDRIKVSCVYGEDTNPYEVTILGSGVKFTLTKEEYRDFLASVKLNKVMI